MINYCHRQNGSPPYLPVIVYPTSTGFYSCYLKNQLGFIFINHGILLLPPLKEKQMQLAGELAKINLASLVQLIRNGELTGKICLTQGALTAFIYVDNGRIIHVEADTSSGPEAFLELFLWTTGSFSFIEGSVSDITRTFTQVDSFEKLVRQGVEYLRQQQYLDQLHINSRSVLKSRILSSANSSNPVLAKLNGVSNLAEIQTQLKLTKKDLVNHLYDLFSSGQAELITASETSNQITLPDWVIARLKQDDTDVSEAIVQMVIWVDLMKCWMFKADADLSRIVDELDGKTNQANKV